MIAYLEGKLLHVDEKSCVALTSGGVGYEIFAPAPVLAAAGVPGDAVSFFTSTIAREDELSLYGFATWDERQVFETLLSISKLGPKLSLAVLTVFSPDDLRAVIANEDVTVLTRVPGIGKKSAQHIFLELKYKLKGQPAPAGGAAGPAAEEASVFRDALAGLSGLGYAEEEVRPVLEKLLKDDPLLDVSGALRATLKEMAKARA